ncbi:hypothetical protein Trco_006387 [Trichoderma cornu-damae]|uniref:Fe2OG dioxygenase domain-containing protein n=1 Tax=Trichoderma cornu-damae TaxID=654480 RepID=A0A9P8QKC2_9HYPO|nr:hypothetical protein Trco_006387 [Trichoderma cornu-damae]
MSQKRTIDAFFGSAPKRPRKDLAVERDGALEEGDENVIESHHPRYPFPIAHLPTSISKELTSLPARPGRTINDEPDLDLLYFEPYIPACLARQMFEHLRAELPFYKVEYQIRRGGIATRVLFGIDETSQFDETGAVVDAKTGEKMPLDGRYEKCPPRPLPKCLDELRQSTEAAANCRFNFCLVNYYASGADSIAFHSDDERFLGQDPAIASFSLGARRDFLMKHKPAAADQGGGVTVKAAVIKFPLKSGDMILMRGKTQSRWLHSIPKRAGKNKEDGGRINITFRRARIKEGTENYYNYNVGSGPVYRWDKTSRAMVPMKPS